MYLVDGRVVAMRPTACATVQAIAERAGEVLQHPWWRIAIVSKGGTDPLAHEIRQRKKHAGRRNCWRSGLTRGRTSASPRAGGWPRVSLGWRWDAPRVG